ncbi:SDR family NAD(P)-dependent oxidoreductase [Morganella morganii]|nr:SDR family NAD(P)-dependent oxidoreductase [Morganella morganii]
MTFTDKFKNKVVWITGASSGYGESLARAFSKAGARLVLSARRQDKLISLAEELGQAVVIPVDLARIDSFTEKSRQAIEAYGQIDYLIHNGALAQNATVQETNLSVERQLMEVDYFSYTELTRCILPHMLQRKCGHIIVVSGLLAHINLPGRSTYAAAKAALIAYFGCLRAELVQSNIRIQVLIPGTMQTELVNKAIKADGHPVEPVDETFSAKGCPPEEAARQALEAIYSEKMLSYIGLQDSSYQLWKLTLNNPEEGIQMLLAKLKDI